MSFQGPTANPEPGSGWFINDLELPEAPYSDNRNITRTFQSQTIFNFFPELTKSTARAFDYNMKGYIYPDWKTWSLDQIAKSADTDIVTLTAPSNEVPFKRVKYAIKSLKINRTGPLFTSYPHPYWHDVTAFPYEITFTEMPDEGEFQEGVDSFTTADEKGVGWNIIHDVAEWSKTPLPIGDYGPTHIMNIFPWIPMS